MEKDYFITPEQSILSFDPWEKITQFALIYHFTWPNLSIFNLRK
jgi:hypothetical protein